MDDQVSDGLSIVSTSLSSGDSNVNAAGELFALLVQNDQVDDSVVPQSLSTAATFQ